MNDNDKFDAFDFIINEEDEVMLLLYAREGEAKDAVIEIDAGNRSAVLYRNEEDGVVIDRIPDDAFDSLQDADSLMVCELSRKGKRTSKSSALTKPISFFNPRTAVSGSDDCPAVPRQDQPDPGG